MASESGLSYFCTEPSDSPSFFRKLELAWCSELSTDSLLVACTCSCASDSPVPAFSASSVITYWLPMLAIEPFSMALMPSRWQISRPTSLVMRSSGARPMNWSVCLTFCSGKTFMYGDCSRSTARAFLSVPSKTGSAVVFTKSATRIASFSDITARVWRRKTVIASPIKANTTKAMTTKFQRRPGRRLGIERTVPELANAESSPDSVSRFKRFRSERTSAAL